MTLRLLTLAAALAVTGCGGGSPPTSPSTPVPPASPPSPSSSETTRWTVSHRFVSVEGPDNCWVRQQRAKLTGVGFGNMAMSVTRSSGSMTVESEWFQTYRGTYTGSQFETTGTQPLEGGGTFCDGTSHQQRPGVSNLSGRFSDDDQQLTGTEANSYQLTSGEPVIYRWAWEATRR
jgi:hypothetical protein